MCFRHHTVFCSAFIRLVWRKASFLICIFYSKYMFCRIFAIIPPDWVIYFATKYQCYNVSTTASEQQLRQISVEADGVRTCLGTEWELCFSCVCQQVVLWILSCRCGCSNTAVLCSEFHDCIPVEWSKGKKADHNFIAKRRHSDCKNVLLQNMLRNKIQSQ